MCLLKLFSKKLLLLVSSALICFPAILHAEIFRIGIINLPPHMYLDEKGKPRGAAVDFFGIVANRMGLKDYVIEEYPLSRLIQNLEQSRIDAALFLENTPERAQKFQYAKNPYFRIKSGVVVRSDSQVIDVSTSEELKGLKIGILQNSYLSPLLSDKSITLEPIAGIDAPKSNLKKLAVNRLDAVYLPCLLAINLTINDLGMKEELKVLSLPEASVPVYAAFSPNVDESFIRKYESVIYESDVETYKSLMGSHISIK